MATGLELPPWNGEGEGVHVVVKIQWIELGVPPSGSRVREELRMDGFTLRCMLKLHYSLDQLVSVLQSLCVHAAMILSRADTGETFRSCSS